MDMEKHQAEEIVEAILQPEKRYQEEIRKKREVEQRDLARKRRVAVFMLIGSAIGVGVAYCLGHRLSGGVVWGGIAGSVVGWTVTWRAA